MARKPRLEFEGACYHVINRGNYRKDLFGSAGTAESFEKVLFAACEKFHWRLHAYVIMSNHFHLAVETPEPNLSLGMKWLQGTFAIRFNRFQGEVGKPFQGRFKALVVEPGRALSCVVHYIHLNPVRAKVAALENLPEYRWSSLPKFIGSKRPSWLAADETLRETGGLNDTKAGWRRYLQYLGWLATDEVAQKDAKFQEMSRGWCIGTAEFRKAIKQEFALTTESLREVRGSDPNASAWREVRTEQWENGLCRAARELKIDLQRLPPRKSAREKVELAAVMKAASSVSNGWLAGHLQMGKPASVSQFVRRFNLAGGMEAPRMKRALSRINK